MWEDPANQMGGKWVVLFRQAAHLLDIAWANLTMALVGQVLDPDDRICGIVASNRPRGNRLQIWTRGREDVEGLNDMGKRCLEMMGIEPGEMEQISFEYQVS
jgi:translation initiation factor 4E